MIIELDDKVRVQDIEEEFSLFYPYLKLELEPLGGLEELRRIDAAEIKSDMTVAALRRLFSEDLQMFAKLSVKKGDGWTDITDEALTLKQANERGRAEAETSQQTRYEDFFETEY